MVPLTLRNAGELAVRSADRHGALIERLARISDLQVGDADIPEGSVQDVLDETTLVLPLADVIDIAEEKARLEKEIAKFDQEIEKFDKKLANENFTAKAPSEVVQEQKDRREEAQASKARLVEALERLS